MTTIPTVKVEAPGGGFMIINKRDFNDDVHVLFEETTVIESGEVESDDEVEEIEEEIDLPGDVAEPKE